MVTAKVNDGLPEPLAAWDARGPKTSTYSRNWRECTEWYDQHIAEPDMRARTFRVEFYLIDSPFCLVYCYYQENGKRFKHVITGEIAVEEPVLIPLGELPPAHLLSP